MRDTGDRNNSNGTNNRAFQLSSLLIEEIDSAISAQSPLPQKGRTYLQAAIDAPHSRTSSRRGMVRFPSKKMGMTIEAPEGALGLAAVKQFEDDTNVVAYFDRPESIKIAHVQNGRKRAFLQFPNFLVVYRDHISLIFLRRVDDKPNRFDDDADAKVRALQEAANDLGFHQELVTDAAFSAAAVRNSRLLEIHYKRCSEGDGIDEKVDFVRSIVLRLGVPTIRQVIDQFDGRAEIVDLHRAIALGLVHCDLHECDLMEHNATRVCVEPERLRAFSTCDGCFNQRVPASDELAFTLSLDDVIVWDDVARRVLHVGATAVTLGPVDRRSTERTTEIPIDTIEVGFRQGAIKRQNNPDALSSAREEDIAIFLKSVSTKDLQTACLRFKRIEPYLSGVKCSSDRTLRRYLKAFRDAQQIHGNGFAALVPGYAKCGNRVLRLVADTVERAVEFVWSRYATPDQRSRKSVHGELVVSLEAEGKVAPSYSWFCVLIKAQNQHELERARKGHKAAYGSAPRRMHDSKTAVDAEPCRAFERVHVDHTQMDIESIYEETGESLGRPWITLMIDHYSRRILAVHIGYDPPSDIAVSMVMRACVQRHHRLPQVLVVDGGKEFRSTWFQTFCAVYGVTLFYRPPAKPRFGAQIERFIGTFNKRFLHQLRGNTQATKDARQITPEVDPATRAVWPLHRLIAKVDNFLFEQYDTLVHRGIGMTPRQCFTLSMERYDSPTARYISFTEGFLFASCPTVAKGTSKVTADGVKVHYFYFNAEQLHLLLGQRVEVRYDPLDVSRAWASVRGQWAQVTSRYEAILRGMSRRAIELFSECLRKQRSGNEKAGLCERDLARFMLETKNEELLLARKRAAAQHAAGHRHDQDADEPGRTEASVDEQPAPAESQVEDFELHILNTFSTDTNP